jgi:hypothetical protein
VPLFQFLTIPYAALLTMAFNMLSKWYLPYSPRVISAQHLLCGTHHDTITKRYITQQIECSFLGFDVECFSGGFGTLSYKHPFQAKAFTVHEIENHGGYKVQFRVRPTPVYLGTHNRTHSPLNRAFWNHYNIPIF